MNGTAYIVLLSFVIYNFSYWTMRVMTSDDETRTTKFINHLGEDLQSTGLDKAAHSLVAMPDNFYKVADLAGLVCLNRQNPQFNERLGRYPAFIS